MAGEWHYSQNGHQHGLISAADLKALAQSGQLSPDDMVWKEGMKGWAKAQSLKGLFPAPESPKPGPPPLTTLADNLPADMPDDEAPTRTRAEPAAPANTFAAILADKWVRIGACVLAGIILITFLPSLFGWNPDGGLIFFNIVLVLVFFNVVVQRHPIMSLLWLYGLDLGLGIFMLLGTLPFFSESAMAGITVIVLIPLNIWTGFQFIREMGRKLSLQGKFLPAHEGGLTLEFTHDGNVILSNGKVYRYATRRNDLLLYDGGTLVTKWEIAKCNQTTLLVKDDQGQLHEYKRDVTTATSTASVGSTGLGPSGKR
jgi:hypothetical protein